MYTTASTRANTVAYSGQKAPEAPSSSAADRVYTGLRDNIRGGRVYPWDRLTEKTLGAHFEASRTPVREALARLVAEGILQRHPDGFGLSLPSPETIGGLYEARLAIELQGIRRVANGAADYDVELLSQLQDRWGQILQEKPTAEPHMTAWDEGFHRGILAAAGEPALVVILAHINDRIRALRMYGYIANEQLVSSSADHLLVLEALIAGRYAEGEAALTEHIISTRNDSLARALDGSRAEGFIRRPVAEPQHQSLEDFAPNHQ